MTINPTEESKEKQLANLCFNYISDNFDWYHNVEAFQNNVANPSWIETIEGHENIATYPPWSDEEKEKSPLYHNSKKIIERNFLLNGLIMLQFSLWEGFNHSFIEKLKEIVPDVPDFTEFKEDKPKEWIKEIGEYRRILREIKKKKKKGSNIEIIRENLSDLIDISEIENWDKFIGYYISRNVITHNSGYPNRKYEGNLKSRGLSRPIMMEIRDYYNEFKIKLVPTFSDIEFIYEFIQKYISVIYYKFTSKYNLKQDRWINEIAEMPDPSYGF